MTITKQQLKAFAGRQSPNGQLLGYESGNLLAATVPMGGPVAFWELLMITFSENAALTDTALQLLNENPEASAAAGILGIIGITTLVNKTVGKLSGKFNTTVNLLGTGAASALVAYAIQADANFITTAACCFAAGSGLLKYANENPFFLKSGGLVLATGGAFLTAFGVDGLVNNDMTHTTTVILDTATIVTGGVVTPAYFMVYDGGAFLTSTYEDDLGDAAPETLTGKIVHPTKGWLSNAFTRYVDKPVLAANTFCKNTLFSWIPKMGLARPDEPFWTSMWARLPARGLMAATAAAAAIETGDSAFWILTGAVGLWAVGDGATGCMEFQNEVNAPEKPSEPS